MKRFLFVLLSLFSTKLANCSETVRSYTENLAYLQKALQNGTTKKIDACAAFFATQQLTQRQKDPLLAIAKKRIELLEEKNKLDNFTHGISQKAFWGLAQLGFSAISLWLGLGVHNYYISQEKTASYTDQNARISSHYNAFFDHINCSNYGSATSQGKKFLQTSASLVSSSVQDYSLHGSGVLASIYGGYYFGSRGIKNLYHAFTYPDYIKNELENAVESEKIIDALKVLNSTPE